jgi:cyclophilin family peptidyl-prolyl cis-trans isomerase
VQHIFKLVALGAYTGNHIFRVDKGFVAQVADVVGGRNLAMDAQQQVSAASSGSNLQAAAAGAKVQGSLVWLTGIDLLDAVRRLACSVV